jgi:hypothetical protein
MSPKDDIPLMKNIKDLMKNIKELIKHNKSSMKSYITKKNGTILLIVLILLWCIFYFIPEIFISLFSTLLGNLILVLATILTFSNDRLLGLALGTIIIILYRFYSLSKTKESFQQNQTSLSGQLTLSNQSTLSKESVKKFLKIQDTINRNTNFDVSKLQQQVTQQELDSFLENGLWPWSKETTDLYLSAMKKNVFIRNHPIEQIKRIRQKYNEAAILEILSMQTKEGIFLTNGVFIRNNNNNNNNNLTNPEETLPSGFGSFGYKSGLITPMNDMIKCNIDILGNNSYLEKTHYTGKGGIFGEQTSITTPVDYNNLEKEIPGFKFLNEPCNPCKVFDSPTNYTCPFELNLKETNQSILPPARTSSSVWKSLWNTNQ